MSKKSTKLEALQNILKNNNISGGMIEWNDSMITEIKKYADGIPDYRHPSYIRHLVGDIIMIVFFAMLGNANEWEEIEIFAKSKEKWLRKYLELPNGIPTDDTIRLVFGNVDTNHFFSITVMYLLQTIDEKTNEIPAAQELLPLLDLKDTIMTSDAMNCQKNTVSAIAKGKGDYVLALKGNHPVFYEEVVRYFDQEVQKSLQQQEKCYYKTIEKEHGGIVTREYYITEDIKWFSDRKDWEKLKAFGMVHKESKNLMEVAW